MTKDVWKKLRINDKTGAFEEIEKGTGYPEDTIVRFRKGVDCNPY